MCLFLLVLIANEIATLYKFPIAHYIASREPKKSNVEIVSRKNRNRNRDNVYDILSCLGNYSCPVITKSDSIKSQAITAINKWNGIDTNNIDHYLDDIVSLHIITSKVEENLAHSSSSHDVIPFLQKKYKDINSIIEAYNVFLDSNPLVRLEYSELKPLNLDGVLII